MEKSRLNFLNKLALAFCLLVIFSTNYNFNYAKAEVGDQSTDSCNEAECTGENSSQESKAARETQNEASKEYFKFPLETSITFVDEAKGYYKYLKDSDIDYLILPKNSKVEKKGVVTYITIPEGEHDFMTKHRQAEESDNKLVERNRNKTYLKTKPESKKNILDKSVLILKNSEIKNYNNQTKKSDSDDSGFDINSLDISNSALSE